MVAQTCNLSTQETVQRDQGFKDSLDYIASLSPNWAIRDLNSKKLKANKLSHTPQKNKLAPVLKRHTAFTCAARVTQHNGHRAKNHEVYVLARHFYSAAL